MYLFEHCTVESSQAQAVKEQYESKGFVVVAVEDIGNGFTLVKAQKPWYNPNATILEIPPKDTTPLTEVSSRDSLGA